MAVAGAHGFAPIERLSGRDNYGTWSFAVKTYLEHENLWKCIDVAPDATLTKEEDIKARSKIVLLVEPMNYIHIQEAKSAKEVWDNLRRAFDDSGLLRKLCCSVSSLAWVGKWMLVH
ncbi:uncharacterized protein LOC112057308 [Bicyclus anynana]|uniref:Uncharacterized protein LOC112057308 n=1 Tax=Bicyclus anynana TaxID=110368 RepID=A0A6J1P726_BICAN|nr:uncharacterized protein LOC112057308 [Bicyclus anynana]